MASGNTQESIIAENAGVANGFAGQKVGNQQDELLGRYQTASSVVIPKEVFESMYLSPYTATHGHLRSVFANPTPM